MAAEVFSQPNIAARLNANFVMVRINASENPVLTQKFAVTSSPMDIIIKPNGQLIHRRTGSIPAERFNNYLDFLQQMIQSERGSVPPPATPGAVPAHPQPTPPPSSVAVGMAPQHNEVNSVPGTPRDTFSHQSSFPQQSPTAQPLGVVSGTVPPSHGNNHPLRTETTLTESTMDTRSTLEYMPYSSQVPVGGFTPPVPPAAVSSSVATVMAELPAPAKMTVEVPLALEGFCPVTLCTEERWSTGNPAYCTMYQGHIFRFATAEAIATFARDPANYIPVAMGEDIVLMVDRNKRVNGNRNFGVCYQGRVFLFANQESLGAFSERPDFYTEIALKYELARKEQSVPIVY
jgi:YHS domain-containing protein